MIEAGKKVVCIKQHSQNMVVKGEIYTVIEIDKLPCKCKTTVINVGVGTSLPYARTRCVKCNSSINNYTGFAWFDIGLFRLVDYDFADKVFEELFENIKV